MSHCPSGSTPVREAANDRAKRSLVRWRPVLDGDQRARALGVAEALATALVARVDAATVVHPAIASTAALVMHYLALSTGLRAGHATAERLVERAIAGVAEQPLTAALHQGLSGVAWVIGHLQDPSGADDGADDGDSLEVVDAALLDALAAHGPWRGDFDLTDGLVGIGVYGLQRRHRPTGRAIVDRVVAHLAQLARPTGRGLAFWRPPDVLGPLVLDEFPTGCFDASMAHGSAGVIAWLADVHRAGLAGNVAGELLDRSVAWLLAQRADHGDRSRFPANVGPDGKPRHGRIAWCIGDPGAAAALYKAACVRRNPAWRDTALEVAHHAARLPHSTTGVVDCFLCHGSLGLAHVYNRLWQATDHVELAAAARGWYAHALDIVPPVSDGMASEATPIHGTAGAALALLAAATVVEPRWDDLLVLGSEAWDG